MNRFKYYILLSCFVVLSCKQKSELQQLSGEVFGSTFSIQYYGKQDIRKSVDSLFQLINNSVSTYQENSEISQWNKGNDSLKLSDDFIRIAQKAQWVNEISEGRYDPTVKTLVEGWGFGNGKPNSELSSTEVKNLLKNVGYQKLIIDTIQKKIFKENKNIQLDFNSIAPGYTSDRLAVVMNKNGIKNYLIDIGGELVAKGNFLDNKSPWKVGIEDPTKPVENREIVQIVELENNSMATSGNYRKIKIDSLGRKIVHTINPISGYPENTEILSATLFNNECSIADALATSVMARNLKEAEEYIYKYHLKAVLIIEKDKKLKILKYNTEKLHIYNPK